MGLVRTVAHWSGTASGAGVVIPVSLITGSWGTTSAILRTFQLARWAAWRASRAVIAWPTCWPSWCQASVRESAKLTLPAV